MKRTSVRLLGERAVRIEGTGCAEVLTQEPAPGVRTEGAGVGEWETEQIPSG